ncbi:hypothetical protein [Luteolibacter sp. Populi]|uniref:hypothetical protein n=1 Tax=Luteolibacter sp. Populi TaxID=3230487 RepID=UPI0034656B6D
MPITEELAAALSKDSRLAIGAWKNGHDGYLDGFWTRQVVIFGSMAPFAGMAGLGGIDQDARATAYAQASDAQLMALGHGPQAVAAIREALGKGLFSAHLVIGEAQKTRDPFSTEAKVAVDQLVAEAEQQQAAVEQAQLSGAMPTFHRSADGTTWTVYDGASSAEIGKAANANDALRLAAARSTAVDEDNADLLAYLGSTMMGIGKLADGKTETLFRPGMELTAEQQAAVSEGDFESIRAQTALRDLLAGTSGMAGVVLGRSVTEFKQGVRRTANQLNDGAALPTVFHETTHGHLEEAWAGGALSRGETESFLRAADTIFAGKTTKDGRPIRFLPDGPVNDTMLREGVSEFAEMELFRTRSGGKAGAGKPAIAGLPSGLISRNIAAFTRLAPGAAEKFTRFIEAARSFWGVTLKRATVMEKAVREGSMSEAELDAFKEKLYGLKGSDAGARNAGGPGGEVRGIPEMGRGTIGEFEDSWDGAAVGRTTSFSLGPMTDPPVRVREILNGAELASVEIDAIQARAGERASDAARRWLAENPQDQLARPGLGQVIFDERSIKDTLGHGFSGPKLNVLVAVPEVIGRGTLIDVSMDHGGKPIRNWILAAPVELGGKRHLLFARLRSEVSDKAGTQGIPRFYVHEVAIEERLHQKIESDSLKTGAASAREVGRDGGIELYLKLARRALGLKEENSGEDGTDRIFREPELEMSDGQSVEVPEELLKNMTRDMDDPYAPREGRVPLDGLAEHVKQVILARATAIAGFEREHGVVLDPDGIQTWSKIGERDRVSVPKGEGWGKLFLHNHPGKSPPSWHDLIKGCEEGVSDMLVATESDLFSVKFLEQNPENFYARWEYFQRIGDAVGREWLRRQGSPDLRTNSEEVYAVIQHAVLVELDRREMIQYSRIRR